MECESSKKNISIINIIIIMLVSVLLITIGGIGYLIFSNWFLSARQTIERVAGNINKEIYNKVYSFVTVPEHMNKENYYNIQKRIVDLSDDGERDSFFVGALHSRKDEIYSFSFGTANGEYYGARRNENGVIEIMRNNAGTGGISKYYSVNSDLTAGQLVVEAGRFDPRTRAWYKAAEKTGGPVFSSIYKHFIMDDLTVSASQPIYGPNGELLGVLGTHMLLSGIGDYLGEAVRDYNGYALIVEKNTGELIGNSMGEANFTVLQSGTVKRYTIEDIKNADLRHVYEQYVSTKDADTQFLYKGETENLYINAKEFYLHGLDWVIISAIPESFLISPVVHNIHRTILLVIAAIGASLCLYYQGARKLLKPMYKLLHVSEAISAGDLLQRVDIARNDEIGRISRSFNKVADKMQFLINNLEVTVSERTEELHKANAVLEENRKQLRLILDSAAEAIYGIDLHENCTFCNTSCIKILGYESQEALLGKNMHSQIHYRRLDGTPFPVDECRITQAIRQGKRTHAADEVFWKTDGTPFEVEYRAHPQIRSGKIVGAVITFMDITERKKREEEIKYLSSHDILTGLHNRRYFEDNRVTIDIVNNIPLSVIFADINGLKMTNDIFGHAAGDALIKKSSEILRQSCQESDMIARVGGDEFIILLPKTHNQDVEKILSRIKSGFENARVAAIKCNISLGYDTKTSIEQSLEEIIANAENAMYKDKTMNRKSINKDIIDTIIETLHVKSPKEKQHSLLVSELCGEMGAVVHLPELVVNKLKRAGYLHDIGKIVLEDSFFSKKNLSEEEVEKVQQHSVVGYRILNLFDDTLDLAEDVYGHHERWDGSGYPRGLKGDEISLLSRIISIVESYERALSRDELSLPSRKKKAIKTILEGAGKQFDPHLAELFVQMLDKKAGQEGIE